MERGQGALELLLIMSGAVIIAIITLVILLQSSSSSGGLLGNSVDAYSTELNAETILDATFGGGSNPDGGGGPADPLDPPAIDSFSPTTGTNPGEVQFDFSLSSIQDGAMVQIKGWKQGTVPTLTDATQFNGAGSTDYFNQFSINGPAYVGSYADVLPENNTPYGFYLLVCNPDSQCDLAGPSPAASMSGTMTPTLPSVAFSAAPNTDPAGIDFTYDVQNLAAGATIAIKGWKQGTIPPLDETTFASTGGEDFAYAQTPSGSSVTNTFKDVMPQANKDYTFYLMACNPGYPCVLSSTDVKTQGSPANGNITIAIGAIEKVYDYSTQKCPSTPEGDIADMPIRAVKLSNGTLWLTRTHTKSRMMIGTNFGNLVPNCTIVFQSTLVPDNVPTLDVKTFAHKEWISAIYREPADSKIHMIVHDEFHDPNAIASPPCKSGQATPGNPCNYFSLTYASAPDVTTPSLNMFQKPSTWQSDPNSFIIGASHLQWPADPDPTKAPPVFGLPMTTNIIKRGSYYYYMNHQLAAVYNTFFTNGVCVARTQNLNDPTSWRYWDGTSYSLRMGDSYTGNGSPSPCAFVGQGQISNMSQTVTWNSYLKKYLLVGNMNTFDPPPYKCGYFFSTSDDLITWTPRQLLWEVPLSTGPCNPQQMNVKAYASIIDHAELTNPNDPNFEISGKTPYIYYTQWNSGLDRDIERAKITFCDSAKEPGICP